MDMLRSGRLPTEMLGSRCLRSRPSSGLRIWGGKVSQWLDRLLHSDSCFGRAWLETMGVGWRGLGLGVQDLGQSQSLILHGLVLQK